MMKTYNNFIEALVSVRNRYVTMSFVCVCVWAKQHDITPLLWCEAGGWNRSSWQSSICFTYHFHGCCGDQCVDSVSRRRRTDKGIPIAKVRPPCERLTFIRISRHLYTESVSRPRKERRASTAMVLTISLQEYSDNLTYNEHNKNERRIKKYFSVWFSWLRCYKLINTIVTSVIIFCF